MTPQEALDMLEQHMDVTAWIHPVKFPGLICGVVIAGDAYIPLINQWYPFSICASAVMYEQEITADICALEAIKSVKLAAAKISLRQLAQDAFGNHQTFIPVLTEALLIEKGEALSIEEIDSAKRFAEENKRRNDFWRSQGVPENGGYFQPTISQVRFRT